MELFGVHLHTFVCLIYVFFLFVQPFIYKSADHRYCVTSCTLLAPNMLTVCSKFNCVPSVFIGYHSLKYTPFMQPSRLYTANTVKQRARNGISQWEYKYLVGYGLEDARFDFWYRQEMCILL